MSALDARIRLLAREEAAALTGGAPTVAAAEGATQAQVAELRGLVEQLTARVEALEEKPAARRTRGKATESSE